MEQIRSYLDLSDDSLFENWNGLEHWKTRPMFRWSTGESNIWINEMDGVLCSLKLLGGGHVSPEFTVLLDGKIKVVEGEISTTPQEYTFFLPQGTKFITIKTQPWRPCDYGSSKDGRILGVGLTEVCFYLEGKTLYSKYRSPSYFAQLYAENGANSSKDIIANCCDMHKTISSTSERIAAIYGCMMCLLEQYPGREINEIDDAEKLMKMVAEIDMPCFDEAGEVANVFITHADAFLYSSIDATSQKNWKANVDFLKNNFFDIDVKMESNIKLFAISEDLIFLFSFGNIYFNSPQSAIFMKMFFKNIANEPTEYVKWHLLRQVRQVALLKSYGRLKSMVETPWIPADNKLYSEIRKFKYGYHSSEKFDYLMGKFFLRRGDFKRAEKYAFVGLRRRRLDYYLSELMGDVLLKQDKYVDAAGYYGRMLAKNAVKAVRHWMVLQNNELNADIRTKMRIAKLLDLAENKSMELKEACVEEVGRVLITERARYGGRSKLIYRNGKFAIIDLQDNEIHGIRSGKDTFYAGSSRRGIPSTEYWKGKIYKKYKSDYNDEYILPVMVFNKETELKFEYRGYTARYIDKSVRRFLPNQWQYLRLIGNCNIESDKDFMVGEPVCLEDHFNKRRLVLNLLIDAVSMEEIQYNLETFMPNTYNFFVKGTIFKHAYGVADWTHPCTSSMFYGLQLRKHQLYHSRVNLKQLPGYKNVAEELKKQGYYCCNYFEDIPRFLANDAYRGYDMHRSMGNDSEAYIADAIHFLQTVKTNVFLNMHFMDVHDSNFNAHETWTCSIDTLGIPYDQILKSDMLVNGNEYFSRKEKMEARLSIYLHSIKEIDRKLGILYDFLEKNYTDEDYLVVLHSDHGGQRYGLSKRHHVHTCLMARGDNVPHHGLIDDEVVSALDWFSIFEHCCGFTPQLPVDSRLPKAFGGKGREYAVTQRLYPNQPYALVINDLEYEYTFHTRDVLSYDAKADMGTADCHLYRHNGINREEIFNQSLLDKYFALAYKEARYFDEPNVISAGNTFENLLIEKRQKRSVQFSLVLDARKGKDFSNLIHSLIKQSFKDFELFILVEDDKNENSGYGKLLADEIKVRTIQAPGTLHLHMVLENLCGAYVLFLTGEEILASRALEALYYTAREHSAVVVENTYVLTKAEINSFPEQIFQEWLSPLDGSPAAWEPVSLVGRVSTRYELWHKADKRIHRGGFFVRKDFLMKLGNVEIPAYGFDELLALYLLFGADSYVRIFAPLHAYVKDSVPEDAELCLETLLQCLNVADSWLKKIPYLVERPQMLEAILAKFFDTFEAHYLSELKQEVVEEAVAKALHKHPAVSSWLVKYLFGRAIGR